MGRKNAFNRQVSLPDRLPKKVKSNITMGLPPNRAQKRMMKATGKSLYEDPDLAEIERQMEAMRESHARILDRAFEKIPLPNCVLLSKDNEKPFLVVLASESPLRESLIELTRERFRDQGLIVLAHDDDSLVKLLDMKPGEMIRIDSETTIGLKPFQKEVLEALVDKNKRWDDSERKDDE